MWATAVGTGPVVGGTLAQLASWRWVFWINLPTCGFAFIPLILFLDVHNPKTKFTEGVKAIDWAGMVTLLGCVLMLLLALNFGE